MPTPRGQSPLLGNEWRQECSFQGTLAAIHTQLSYVSKLVTDLGAQHERELAKVHSPSDFPPTPALLGRPSTEMRCTDGAKEKKARMTDGSVLEKFDFDAPEAFQLSQEDMAECDMELPYKDENGYCKRMASIGPIDSSQSLRVSFPAPNQQLLYAIISGSEADVAGLLSMSADPNTVFEDFLCGGKDFISGTPLAVAVLGGRADCVKLLVAAQAELESTYSFTAGAQQIHWSGPASHATIPRGDIQLLTDLMYMGADLHAVGSNGATLLWQAAYFGKADMLQLLIRRNADIEQSATSQDDESLTLTPLHAAAIAGHHNTVGALLHARANPMVLNSRVQGMSPLDDAIQQGHDKVAQLLVAACADLFRVYEEDLSEVAPNRNSTFSSIRSTFVSYMPSSTWGGPTRCIDQLFKTQNPGLIAAVAKGLKEAPTLIDQLCNRELAQFIACPGDAPVDILDAVFRPFQLLYWTTDGKKMRRARRRAAYIGCKGMNVVEGPHERTISDSFNSKEKISPAMELFIEQLAPSIRPFNSVYMPANFYMCCVPLVHQDLSLLTALADCQGHEVFQRAGCQAIVNLKWRGTWLSVLVQLLLHFVELLNMQYIVYHVHNGVGPGSRYSIGVTFCLAALFWLTNIITDIARCVGYMTCGLMRRYFLRPQEWLLKVEHVLIGCFLLRLFKGQRMLDSDGMMVLLGIASCWKWMSLLREMINQETVGLRILPVTVTLTEAGPFCLVLVVVLLATSSFYYALGIHSFADCFLILFQLFALGETDLFNMENVFAPTLKLPSWDSWRNGGSAEILQELPPKTQYYWLLRVMFVVLSFLVGVSLMNLYVAIICSRYVQAVENAWLFFMRCRTRTILDHHAMRLGFAVMLCAGRKRGRGFIGMGSTDSIPAVRMSSVELQQFCAYKIDTAYVWFAAQRVPEEEDCGEVAPTVGPSMSRVRTGTTIRVRSSKNGRS